MNRPLAKEVLTVTEAAKFLRLTSRKVRSLAESGALPARKVEAKWLFLKSALDDWLRGKPDPTAALLQMAGMFKDDESLPKILKEIYTARGRPEDGDIAP